MIKQLANFNKSPPPPRPPVAWRWNVTMAEGPPIPAPRSPKTFLTPIKPTPDHSQPSSKPSKHKKPRTSPRDAEVLRTT